jgi:hypothetical protein
MHILVDSAVENLLQGIDLDQGVDATIISLETHLSVEINQCLEIVEYSEVISLRARFIQSSDPYKLSLGVDLLLMNPDLILTVGLVGI